MEFSNLLYILCFETWVKLNYVFLIQRNGVDFPPQSSSDFLLFYKEHKVYDLCS